MSDPTWKTLVAGPSIGRLLDDRQAAVSVGLGFVGGMRRDEMGLNVGVHRAEVSSGLERGGVVGRGTKWLPRGRPTREGGDFDWHGAACASARPRTELNANRYSPARGGDEDGFAVRGDVSLQPVKLYDVVEIEESEVGCEEAVVLLSILVKRSTHT